VFVPIKLGAAPPEDMGVCRNYADQCTTQCTPSDGTSIPKRRVCTKFCHQKVPAESKVGKKMLLVCRMKKVVECTNDVASGESGNIAGSQGGEVSEQCSHKSSAQCMAAMPFSAAANTLSASDIMELQEAYSTAQVGSDSTSTDIEYTEESTADSSKESAAADVVDDPVQYGCSSLGDTLAAVQACQSSLLMY
jgi:hypothetical protein